MAKKKKDLTPYQQARRQFVQQRVEARGVEGTPEQRAQFRQRFDVLASTVQGRGKIAQQLGAEEPKAFRRMLATEMPARSDLGKTGPTTPTTQTGPVGPSYTADQIARMRTSAATMGPQLSMVQKPAAGSFGATQKVGSYTGPSLKTSSKSKFPTITNPLARKISSGLQAVVPGLSDVAKARKELDKGNVVGGLGRLAAGTAQTAATVASLFGFGGAPRTNIRTSPAASKPPVRPTAPKPPKGGPVRPKAPKGPLPSRNRVNDQLGKQMDDYQSTLGNLKKPSKTAPKTKAPTPKQMPKKASTPKPTPKQMPKKASTPAPTPKQMPKTAAPKTAPKKSDASDLAKIEAEFGKVKFAEPAKAPAAKAPAAKPVKATKASKAKAEDTNFVLGSLKAKYPKATEADIPFIQKVLRAQEAIAKNEPSSRQYQVYLNSPLIQKQLRALRGK